MSAAGVKRAKCTDCEHLAYNNSLNARICNGVFLPVGCRYCTGGKRIRVFKPSDPKTFIPQWCPRHKSPPEIRVYCYKDTDAWYICQLLRGDGIQCPPEGYRYAVRYESHTPMTAQQFFQSTQEQYVDDILGFHVNCDEVIEIDDGIRPFFFHITEHGVDVLVHFNSKVARKNRLKE